MTGQAQRIWIAVAWVAGVVATTINGVVVGYGVIWFQLFGHRANAEDYVVSAGGYAAAALVLIFATVAVRTHDGPRWLAGPAVGAAVVLALLAARSATLAAQLAPGHAPWGAAWDGVGGVLWAPWTWVLVFLGARGAVQWVRGWARR